MAIDDREFQEVKTTLEEHLKSCDRAAKSNTSAQDETRKMVVAVSNRLWVLLATTLIGMTSILGAVLIK